LYQSVLWEKFIARVIDFTPALSIIVVTIDIYVILWFFFCLNKLSVRLLAGETDCLKFPGN